MYNWNPRRWRKWDFRNIGKWETSAAMGPNMPLAELLPESHNGIQAMLLSLPGHARVPSHLNWPEKFLCLPSGYWGCAKGHGGFKLRGGNKAEGYYGCWETREWWNGSRAHWEESGYPSMQKWFSSRWLPLDCKEAEILDNLMEKRKEKLDSVIEFCIPDSLLIWESQEGWFIPLVAIPAMRISTPTKEPMKDDIRGELFVLQSDENERALKIHLEGHYTHWWEPHCWSPTDTSQSPDVMFPIILAAFSKAKS